MVAFPAIIRFIPIMRTPAVRRAVLQAAMILAGLVIPFAAIAVAFCLYYLATEVADGHVMLAAIAAVLGFVAMFLLNIMLTGPHRLYRDQLARTFIDRDDKEVEPVPLDHSMRPDLRRTI